MLNLVRKLRKATAKAWSQTDATSGPNWDYDRYITGTVPSNVKVTKITCWGSREDISPEVGYVSLYLYLNGSSSAITTSLDRLNYGTLTWTNKSGIDVNSIRIDNWGVSLPSQVGYTIYGEIEE